MPYEGSTFVDASGRIRLRPILLILTGLLSIGLLFGSYYTVPAGHQAVEYSYISGVKEGTTDAGAHWKLPLIEKVTRYKIQKQLYSVDAEAASRDGQDVHTQVGVGYHPDPLWVNWLHQNIGPGFVQIIIAPSVQEAVKASTAHHFALDLIRNRSAVNDEIRLILDARLNQNHIVMDELSITDFDYSEVFNAALEAKVTAEQDALAAKNKLEQVKYEAQQKIEEARGQAEAVRILSEQLQASGPGYIDWMWVQKWNGIMPSVMGGDTSILFPAPGRENRTANP